MQTSCKQQNLTARLVSHSHVGLCKLTSCRPATSLTAAQQWDHCQSPAINDSPLVINQRHWLPSITSSGAQCEPILDPTTWTMGARCARSGMLRAICVKTAARRRALVFSSSRALAKVASSSEPIAFSKFGQVSLQKRPMLFLLHTDRQHDIGFPSLHLPQGVFNVKTDAA